MNREGSSAGEQVVQAEGCLKRWSLLQGRCLAATAATPGVAFAAPTKLNSVIMKNRKQKINNAINYWQRYLDLGSWQINFKLKKFTRTDFVQSGDIRVDLDNKKATILISKDKTGRDEYIVLHELVHLILWKFDRYAEKNISETKKDKYFELLEQSVKDITDIVFQSRL